MAISSLLQEFRRAHPGCTAVAYGDLSTRMILATDADGDHPQEWWDAIGHAAHHHLAGAKAQQIAKMLRTDVITAIAGSVDNVDLFFRSIGEPDDVLCCRCRADIAIDALVREATQTLVRIAHDE